MTQSQYSRGDKGGSTTPVDDSHRAITREHITAALVDVREAQGQDMLHAAAVFSRTSVRVEAGSAAQVAVTLALAYQADAPRHAAGGGHQPQRHGASPCIAPDP